MNLNYARLKAKVRAYLEKEHAKGGIFADIVSDRLFSPKLWKWQRNSVARGVAVGSFWAIVPVPMQSIWAAISCVWARANIPISFFIAWLTFPGSMIVIVPLQWLFGAWLITRIGFSGSGMEYERMKALVYSLKDHFSWGHIVTFAEGISPWLLVAELLLGVVLSCILAAVLGYFLTQSVWFICSWIRLIFKSFKSKSPSAS